MEKKEIVKIMGTLKAAYPNSFRKMSEDDYKAMIELWDRQFKDYDYKIVMMAIDSIISSDTREFYPPIATIKEMIYKLTHQDEMTEQEAWLLVKRALRNSGYHAREEFDKLPEVIQRLVGSPQQLYDWSMMNTDQVDTVVASNFMRSYKVRAKHEKELIAIPPSVKNALGIETMANQMRIENVSHSTLIECKRGMLDEVRKKERDKALLISQGGFNFEEMKMIDLFADKMSINKGCNASDVYFVLCEKLSQGLKPSLLLKHVRDYLNE